MKHRDLVHLDDSLTGPPEASPGNGSRPRESTAEHDPFAYSRGLADLKAYVRKNVGRWIRAEEAAAVVKVSPDYFSAWFKHRSEGLLWRDWHAEQHLLEAERLFQAHNYQILEAGFEAGFGSPSAFEHACKKHRGMTPKELKAAVRSSAGL